MEEPAFSGLLTVAATRGAVLLLIGFAAIAEQLGLEVILGAFAAGAVLTLLAM